VDEPRVRKNQYVFREVNQRIAEITRRHDERSSGFLCECGRPGCGSIVDLGLVEYEATREREDLFIVAPGHCVEGVDRLIEARDGYEVIEQL
jgi:hypothetical protein